MDNSSSANPVQPAPKSPSPEQARLEFELSSPEKMQLEFRPSPLDSGPLDVPKDPLDLSSLGAVLPRTIDFIDFLITQDLEIPCESTRNRLDTSFLKTLASKENPDQATSGFIADAIGDNDDTCLWLNVNFALEGHNTPKGLFLHLFTNTTAEIVLSHEVRSMIIQASEPLDSHLNIREFIEILFSKVSFTKLSCLMLYGFQLSGKFLQCIGGLNLEVFHMAKSTYDIDLETFKSFCYFDALERLYIVYSDDILLVVSLYKLKKLVIYFPESSRSVTNRTEDCCADGRTILLGGCCALQEM
jgi:hypothetical protein